MRQRVLTVREGRWEQSVAALSDERDVLFGMVPSLEEHCRVGLQRFWRGGLTAGAVKG
ncbi:hypothetical protein [Nocardiopsis sp. Huas11]|uniref:hypothetical protein n=1 Tax=Nocardiopsis sp. Huas11 TaxID=2183912 RepID=UPI001F4184AB|nr:hypothetical protein [Nocardiopsis sp. Huas11]